MEQRKRTRIRLQKEVLSSNEHKPVISTTEKGFFWPQKMGLEKKIKKAFHRKTSSSNPLSTKEQIFQLQSLSSLLPHFLMISKMSLFIFQITLFIYPWVECRLSIKFRFSSADQRILVNSAHLKKCGFSKFPHVRAISGKPYFSSRISLANKKHVSPCQEARIKMLTME